MTRRDGNRKRHSLHMQIQSLWSSPNNIYQSLFLNQISITNNVFFVNSFPQGLEDVSKYPALIQELLQRDWTENELADVLRRNFLRVFEEVEQVSWKIYIFHLKPDFTSYILLNTDGTVLLLYTNWN